MTSILQPIIQFQAADRFPQERSNEHGLTMIESRKKKNSRPSIFLTNPNVKSSKMFGK